MLQNNANDISITILENQNDIEQSIYPESLKKKKVKKNLRGKLLKTAMIFYFITLLLTAVTAVLYVIEGDAGLAALYIAETVFLLGVYIFASRRNKKILSESNDKNRAARMKQYANGFAPVTYSFSVDKIKLFTEKYFTETSTRNIYRVNEYSEGIFISLTAPFFAYGIWMPARFISKADSARLIPLLKEKAGKRYHTVKELTAPDTAEPVQKASAKEVNGEKICSYSVEFSKVKAIWGVISGIIKKIKSDIIMIAMYVLLLIISGSVRDVFKTGKLIGKIVRLVAKYTELGQVISQADLIDTAQSLLITLIGYMITIVLLFFIAIFILNIVEKIIFTIREYISAKPVIDREKNVDIYDDAIVSLSETSRYVMPWSSIVKAVKKNGRVEVLDNTNRFLTITTKNLEKEQKKLLFDMLTERLGRNWHKPQTVLAASENAVYKADTYGSKTE